MTELTLQGHTFNISDAVIARYTVGYTLQDESEANALRQAAFTNIRQNCNNRVKKALNGGTDLDVDKVQNEITAYAESYKFGNRSAKRGSRIVDPVAREMVKLAREDIEAAFFAKYGEKPTREQLVAKANELLEVKRDDFSRRARRVLADREKAGLETLAAVGL